MAGFFRCLGAAILSKGLRALAAEVPFGSLLWEVAEDASRRMKDGSQTGEVNAKMIVNVAAASPEQTKVEIAQVVEELASGQPSKIKENLTIYLSQVPASMRRSFRRPDDPSGRSVPGSFSIKSGKDLVSMLPSRLPRFKPGDRPLPGWQLTELLGVGGFGEVWKGTSLEIKNLPPRAFKFCLDSTAAESIRREAAFLDQVMKQKLEKGIVQLLDAHLSSDPICLVYEYIPGGDLTALLTRMQKYPPEKRIDHSQRIMRSLARTVGRMHQLTPPMVHRDLKPANVLVREVVREKDRALEFLIADFGIGAVVAEKSVVAERSGTTSEGDLLATMAQGSCTPLYASPQQKAGESADPRDDVYALGVIWYQLLMGDPTKGVSTDYIYDLRELGMKEPAIRLLGNCVAAKLERRPANAGELSKELDALAQTQAPTPPADPEKEVAEALFTAYQSALERQNWSEALTALRQAITLKPERFAPFPVDRYEPTRILGASAFGVVFVCQDRNLGKSVVVKSLRTAELNRDVSDIVAEARTLEDLDHPAIIKLRDFSFADTSRTRPFLVMDFFDGPDLEHYVEEQGLLSREDALAILQPVAEALQVAHSRGILHRDVKPENILIRRDGSNWKVKLIDFGLALRPATLEGNESVPASPTALDKSIARTLQYAAPEQTGDSQAPVGTYSDVYGFGRVCYFALFGTPEPDDDEKENLPDEWRRLLSGCTRRKVENRIQDFAAVLASLAQARQSASAQTVPTVAPAPQPKASASAVAQSQPKEMAGPLLYLNSKGITAKGYASMDGFAVLSGSHAVKGTVPSVLASIVKLRNKLLEQGDLAPEGELLVLVKDCVFDSPSSAASVLLGRNANGRIEWKDEDGTTLKELQTTAESEFGEEAVPGEPAGQGDNHGDSDRTGLRAKFWEHLLLRAKEKNVPLHANISPGDYVSIGAGSGVRGLPFNYAIGQDEGRVELYIDRGKDERDTNKRIFDRLHRQRKKIETAFGDELSWLRLRDKRGCRIAYSITLGGYKTDESKWPAIQDSMIDAMTRLEKAFAPPLAKLKTELESEDSSFSERGSSSGEEWDEPSFLKALRANQGNKEHRVARSVLDWANAKPLRISWGKGAKDGSFTLFFDWNATKNSIITVWTYGRIEVLFQSMKERPPFDSEAKRHELRERLNRIPGVDIPVDSIVLRPRIFLSALSDETALSQFLAVLDWFVEELKIPASSSPLVPPSSPAPVQQSRWYCAKGGRKEGPFTTDQMQAFIRDGSLQPAAMVIQEGAAKWQEARSINEFNIPS